MKNLAKKKEAAITKLVTDYDINDVKKVLESASYAQGLDDELVRVFRGDANGNEHLAQEWIDKYRVPKDSPLYLKKWANISQVDFKSISLPTLSNYKSLYQEGKDLAQKEEELKTQTPTSSPIMDTLSSMASKLTQAPSSPYPSKPPSLVFTDTPTPEFKEAAKEQVIDANNDREKKEEELKSIAYSGDLTKYTRYKELSDEIGVVDTNFEKLKTESQRIPDVNIRDENAKEIKLNQEQGVVSPGHLPYPTNTQMPSNAPLQFDAGQINLRSDPILPVGQVAWEVGRNLALDAGQLAGAALAYQNFGPQGATIFSSLYNNFLREMATQNQPYRNVAGQISQDITSAGLKASLLFNQSGNNGPLQTLAQQRNDFINGNSNPKRAREDDVLNPAEKFIKSRSEVSPLSADASLIVPSQSLDTFHNVSPLVTQAFLQRSSGDLVQQSQQDYLNWMKNTGDYAVRN